MNGDISYKSPAKQFRVVIEDTFPWPHKEDVLGDFPELETAKAQGKEGEFTLVKIYDDAGERVA